jgi:hypothetical protein
MADASTVQGEIEALRAAYAKGIRRVSYQGNTVEYTDGADMLQRIRYLERLLAELLSAPKPRVGYLQHGRG